MHSVFAGTTLTKLSRIANAGELNTLIIGYDNDVQVALIINSELGGSKGMVSIINEAHDEAYKMIKIKAGDVTRGVKK